MKRNKTILIAGGMGALASLELHKYVLSLSNANDEKCPNIIHHSFAKEIPSRQAFLKGGSKKNPGEFLFSLLEPHLSAMKNREIVLGIPCNSFHHPSIFRVFTSKIAKRFPNVQVLDLFKILQIHLADRSIASVFFLSSGGLRQSGALDDYLAKKSISIQTVDDATQSLLDEAIYSSEFGLKISYPPKSLAIKKVAEAMRRIQIPEEIPIVLACTELSLIDYTSVLPNHQIIDPLELLAEELVNHSEVQ